MKIKILEIFEHRKAEFYMEIPKAKERKRRETTKTIPPCLGIRDNRGIKQAAI
jgi:hypothetical protein